MKQLQKKQNLKLTVNVGREELYIVVIPSCLFSAKQNISQFENEKKSLGKLLCKNIVFIIHYINRFSVLC